MGTPQLWGNDISVSGFGDNDEPQITALADGRFVVAWVDNDAQEIRAQILNADGTLRGNPFTIGSTPYGEQMHPNIVSLADGRFVAVWTDQSAPQYDDNTGEFGGNRADVFGQIFTIDGTASSGVFKVNAGVPPAHAFHQPGVTALKDGGFAITWRDYMTSDEPGVDHAEVWFVRHDSQGNQVVAPQLIDYSTHYQDVQPVVRELDNGNLVIAWTQGTTTNEIKLLARIVDADGVLVRELGDIGAAYDSVGDLVQSTPEIAKLADGGFVVTWKVEDGSTGAHDFAVWARVFNQDGSARTEAFNISPPENVEVDPVVTALKDGRFMVSWANFTLEGTNDSEIKSQVYTAAGVKDGDTFTIHTPDAWAHDQMPRITTLEDGRVAISWWHDGEPTIRARIIDPRESGITLTGTSLHDDYVGTRFNDVLNGGQGNDQFDGGAGSDLINGGDGFDTVSFSSALGGVVASLTAGSAGDAAGDSYISIERVIGSRFNDRLYGNGAAVLQGAAGDDTYYVVNSGDQVIETAGGGRDTVIVNGTSYRLAADAEVEEIRFASVSSRKSYSITGSSQNNSLKGNVGKDTLTGLDGRDTLSGSSGDDKLYGGSGNDALTGGSGKDVFVFDTKLGTSTTDRRVNFDTLSDFSTRDDTIRLENKIFTKLTKTGTLSKAFFTVGSKAKDKNDFIVYNKSTGVLSYDADGSGSKYKAVEFAQVKKGLPLAHNDFYVV